jgi:surface antigen
MMVRRSVGAVALVLLLVSAGCTTVRPGGAIAALVPDSTQGLDEKIQGGLVSGPAADGLGRSERRLALAAEFNALEYGQSGKPIRWQGGAGRSGEVVPAQPYRVGRQDCRQYMHNLTVSGQTRTVKGTACRNADGTWTTLT